MTDLSLSPDTTLRHLLDEVVEWSRLTKILDTHDFEMSEVVSFFIADINLLISTKTYALREIAFTNFNSEDFYERANNALIGSSVFVRDFQRNARELVNMSYALERFMVNTSRLIQLEDFEKLRVEVLAFSTSRYDWPQVLDLLRNKEKGRSYLLKLFNRRLVSDIEGSLHISAKTARTLTVGDGEVDLDLLKLLSNFSLKFIPGTKLSSTSYFALQESCFRTLKLIRRLQLESYENSEK